MKHMWRQGETNPTTTIRRRDDSFLEYWAYMERMHGSDPTYIFELDLRQMGIAAVRNEELLTENS